jgi:hypothetical protein
MAQLLWSGLLWFFLPCIPIAKNRKWKQRLVRVGGHALAVEA